MRAKQILNFSFMLFLVIALLNLSAPVQAQTLFKCKTAAGTIEYRNTTCEPNQRSAGAVKGGTITQVPANTEPRSKPNDAGVTAVGLDKLDLSKLNPVQAIREQVLGTYDAAVAMECRSHGRHYFEGAGCLNHPEKNLNPGISEPKMRGLCNKVGKRYVKLLNECYAKKAQEN